MTALLDTENKDGESSSQPPPLRRSTVLFMAVSVGVIVANIYYVQPLLASLARQFHISVAAAGEIAMVSQLGSATGMLCLVPLGDTVERRRLISWAIGAEAAFSLLAACSPNAITFALAAIGLGVSASCVHVFLPFAAHLAKPNERGKVVGIVLSGLLMGILLARTFSGAMAAFAGWRSVYAVAAVALLVLLGFVRVLLPRDRPNLSMNYLDLLRSVWQFARTHQQLREAALVGAALFCSFSAFWTTLVFFLETPPYHYGSEVAGAFGLVGAAGAAGAAVVGRMADRFPVRALVWMGVLLVTGSFVELLFFGHSLLGLIAGVLVLDFGVQAAHVSNQSRIYALDHTARSRLNTFYMFSYFIGGSTGSVVAAYCWQYAGWLGVCGFALTVLSVLTLYLARVQLALFRSNPARPGKHG